MDMIEYCNVCFFKGRPHLCETYKGVFTKISPIHFSQQNKLERMLNGMSVRPKLVERRWTCTLDKIQRDNFLSSLWGIGITVHTLEDHVKVLTNLYRPEIQKLGKLVEIEHPLYDSWKVFDPKKRDWVDLKLSKKQDKLVSKVNLGSILMRADSEGKSYFRTISSDDKPTIVSIEERAALNMIVTQVEPITAHWQTDEKNLLGFIKSQSLENLPEEIFSTIKRLKSHEKTVDGFFNFDTDDFELIKTVLASAKINLIKSTEMVQIDHNKKLESSVLIADVEKDRILALTAMLSELGAKIEQDQNQLTVTGKLDSVKLNFVSDNKSAQEGRMISVSMSALEEPQRTAELLSILKKRLGLLGMPIETLVCRYWPIITDSDLQYTVQSIIEYSKIDKNLALSVISDQKKFDKVNEWNSKIKEGKLRSSLDTITLGKILKLH